MIFIAFPFIVGAVLYGSIRLALYLSRMSKTPLVIKEEDAALGRRGYGSMPNHVNCRCYLIRGDIAFLPTTQAMLEEFEKYRWRAAPVFDCVAALEGNIKKVVPGGRDEYERDWFFDGE